MLSMACELRDDALSIDRDGFVLRVGLPWMRSLPLSCVLDLVIQINGCSVPAEDVRVCLAASRAPLADLPDKDGWWFLQDRLVLAGPLTASAESHYDVEVSMRLLLPYLDSPSGGPAVLPFRFGRRLHMEAPTAVGAFRDVS
jgi:hypothetical protein